MAVQRYHRKPNPNHRTVTYTAARYEPGKPLTDLAEIVRMADAKGEVAEAVFPSGRCVLIARYEQHCDGERIGVDTEVVEADEYLMHSSGSGYLHATDDDDLMQFYAAES